MVLCVFFLVNSVLNFVLGWEFCLCVLVKCIFVEIVWDICVSRDCNLFYWVGWCVRYCGDFGMLNYSSIENVIGSMLFSKKRLC